MSLPYRNMTIFNGFNPKIHKTALITYQPEQFFLTQDPFKTFFATSYQRYRYRQEPLARFSTGWGDGEFPSKSNSFNFWPLVDRLLHEC